MSSWNTSEWAEELRALWNSYDPIGVYSFEDSSEWPKDEYDSYHGLVLSLLQSGADDYKFMSRIKHLVTVSIGMTWNARLENDTKAFIKSTRSWFETKKPELTK